MFSCGVLLNGGIATFAACSFAHSAIFTASTHDDNSYASHSHRKSGLWSRNHWILRWNGSGNEATVASNSSRCSLNFCFCSATYLSRRCFWSSSTSSAVMKNTVSSSRSTPRINDPWYVYTLIRWPTSGLTPYFFDRPIPYPSYEITQTVSCSFTFLISPTLDWPIASNRSVSWSVITSPVLRPGTPFSGGGWHGTMDATGIEPVSAASLLT